MKKKTKLEGLEVTKVDFVDVGADQKADIMITKRDDEGETADKTPFYKKFFNTVCKSLGIDESTVEKSMEAHTFDQTLNQAKLEDVRREIYLTCDALRESMFSILHDESCVDKASVMNNSIDQFTAFAKEAVDKWSGLEVTEAVQKSDTVPDDFTISLMQESIDKACSNKKVEKEEDPEEPEKEDNDMKFDKNKMSPVEKAYLEDLEKRYGINEPATEQEPAEVNKSAHEEVDVKDEVQKAVSEALSEVTKGFQAQLEAVFAPVQKKAEELEAAELASVAKKYEIIGMTSDKMVPVLKNLKSVSQEAYDNFITTLDAQVDAVEKSGLFTEIGKRGVNGGTSPEAMTSEQAWTEIEKRAGDMMEKDPSVNYAQAIDAVCLANPKLVHAYENK